MKRTFAWFFAIILLSFCVANTLFFIQSQSYLTQIAQAANDLEITLGKGRKQQAEYDQYAHELPLSQETLLALEPQAQAATKRIDDMKAERKTLRKQIEENEQALQAIVPIDITMLQKEVETLQATISSLKESLAQLQ